MAQMSIEGRVAMLEAQLEDLKAEIQLAKATDGRTHQVPNGPCTSVAAPERRTISQRILARASSAPPEECTGIPSDLAEQHDHYTYGWPKS